MSFVAAPQARAVSCQTLPGSAVQARLPPGWAAEGIPTDATRTALYATLAGNVQVAVMVELDPLGRGAYCGNMQWTDAGEQVADGARPSFFSDGYRRFWSNAAGTHMYACAETKGSGPLDVVVLFPDDQWKSSNELAAAVAPLTDAVLAGYRGSCRGPSYLAYLGIGSSMYRPDDNSGGVHVAANFSGDLHLAIGTGASRLGLALHGDFGVGTGNDLFWRTMGFVGYVHAFGTRDLGVLVGGGGDGRPEIEQPTFMTDPRPALTAPATALVGGEIFATTPVGSSSHVFLEAQLLQRRDDSTLEGGLTIVLLPSSFLSIGAEVRRAAGADSIGLSIALTGHRRRDPDRPSKPAAPHIHAPPTSALPSATSTMVTAPAGAGAASTDSGTPPSNSAGWWCFDGEDGGLCERTEDDCGGDLGLSQLSGGYDDAQCTTTSVAYCYSYTGSDDAKQKQGCMPSMQECTDEAQKATAEADHPYAQPGSVTACVETY